MLEALTQQLQTLAQAMVAWAILFTIFMVTVGSLRKK